MRATNLWACAAVLGLAATVRAGDWQAIPLDQVTKDKPGYGGLSGVVVDHDNGDVYVYVSDLGLFRSKDQGKTWSGSAHGPTEGPHGAARLPADRPDRQAQRIMAAATVYGGPVAAGNWATTASGGR